MPSACCAVGCANRKSKCPNLEFYRIPPKRNMERRKKWLSAIKRTDWPENLINNARLCSEHFISGKLTDCVNIFEFLFYVLCCLI